jgi:hypothetical protein
MSHLSRNVIPNVDLLIIQKHPIDSFYSNLGGLSRLIVNISITTRATLFVGCDFAR